MAKIGRNESCPCGSGKKYKRCCKIKSAITSPIPPSPHPLQATLMNAVEKLQQDATAMRLICRELGVFFFFTTPKGDAWVLEMTNQDALQVAKQGNPLETPINENPETIEINWTHTFVLKEKKLEFTTYADKSSFFLDDAPAQKLNAAIRRIRKRFTTEQLKQIHLDSAG